MSVQVTLLDLRSRNWQPDWWELTTRSLTERSLWLIWSPNRLQNAQRAKGNSVCVRFRNEIQRKSNELFRNAETEKIDIVSVEFPLYFLYWPHILHSDWLFVGSSLCKSAVILWHLAERIKNGLPNHFAALVVMVVVIKSPKPVARF